MHSIKKMDNLIIDLGNTASKAFVFRQERLIKKFFASDDKASIDNIEHICKNYSINKIIYSSVKKTDNLIISYIKNIGIKLIEVNTKIALPINIHYKTKTTLGQDRIAAVCGASVVFPNKNVLIIDVGTAITYDILIAGKDYLGGLISPGINTRFKSLHNFTEKLPLLNINKNINTVYGTSTNEAIIAGVQNGVLYEIKGNIKAFSSKFDDLKIVFTGGDSFFFENLIKNPIFAEPNLTAFGLNKILEINE